MKKITGILALVCFVFSGTAFATTTEGEKKTKLNATELAEFFGHQLENAIEIGHVQEEAELEEIQQTLNVKEELSYVRVYKEDDKVSTVVVTKNKSAYVFTETNSLLTDCGCFNNGNYHVAGDHFFCSRACSAP